MTSKAFGLAQLGNAYSDGALSNRNKIINGAMIIDQRNAGASVTANDGVFSVDRWACIDTVNGKFSMQQNAASVTPPAGFKNYLGCTSTAATALGATDFYHVRHKIEGFNADDLSWGTSDAKAATLSFWVRSSLTGVFGGSINNSVFNRSYPFSFTISSANTWEYKTVAIAGDTSGTWLTANNIGIQISFSLGSGSTYSGTAGSWSGSSLASATGAVSVVGTNGATFYITGVQLEAGDTATPFEHRSYGAELALCQRYFQQFDVFPGPSFASFIGYYGGSNVLSPVQRLSVPMRVTPTIAIANSGVEYYSFGLAWTGTTLTAIPRSSEMYYIYCATDADGRGKLLRNGSSGAGPNPIASFSAEL